MNTEYKNVTIHWLRHGKIQDVEHLDKFLHPDEIGLSEEGRSKANLVSKVIKPHEKSLLYCSTVRRAKETAEIIFNSNKEIFERIVHDNKLDEYFPKELFGLTLSDAKQKYGNDFFEKFLSDPLNCELFTESEAITKACERVNEFIKDIINKNTTGADIWIVGHGTLHNIWLICLLNENLSRSFNIYKLDYLAKTTICYDSGKGFSILEVNKSLL